MTSPFEPPADGLYHELLWVHGKLRQDLRTVERLASEVEGGAPAESVATTIAKLETEGPLWKLRVNCLYYCRFVHHHHRLEDVALFPAVRRRQPELNELVDRLERDHLHIGAYIDTINQCVRELGQRDSHAVREELIRALRDLASHLVAHLQVEEESLKTVLSSMSFADITG